MARINENYLKLTAGYLFPEIDRRTRAYLERSPGARLIRLGIGDVVLPLPKSVRDAMHRALDELGTEEGFRGYPPFAGYDFLREAIVQGDFLPRGVSLSPEEIYVSDGSKCDSGNIQEIFARDARVAIPDPVYPVYLDTNVMAGRTGPSSGGRYAGVQYLECREENDFLPEPPGEPVDLVYLCFPNNPTGAVASRASLERWVAWARARNTVLLFDAAYEAYITDPAIPHSIYEIEGARECAIEFRSYSKTAGFTGLRCAYIVVPAGLSGRTAAGERVELSRLWSRRHSTKFNGVAYPVQCAAAATYTREGREETRSNVRYYLDNARVIREGLQAAGLRAHGGVHAPYVWAKTPVGTDSWQFFDRLLERAQVVCTPGAGFGACGEGYVRFSAFAKRESVENALSRIREQL